MNCGNFEIYVILAHSILYITIVICSKLNVHSINAPLVIRFASEASDCQLETSKTASTNKHNGSVQTRLSWSVFAAMAFLLVDPTPHFRIDLCLSRSQTQRCKIRGLYTKTCRASALPFICMDHC